MRVHSPSAAAQRQYPNQLWPLTSMHCSRGASANAVPQRAACGGVGAGPACLALPPRPVRAAGLGTVHSCRQNRRPARRRVAAGVGPDVAVTAATVAVDLLQAVSGHASALASDIVTLPPEQAAQLTMDTITAAVQESISGSSLSQASMGLPWSPYTPLACAWQAYCSALEAKPLETKLLTGLLGTFLGDVTAQYYMATQQGTGSMESSSSRAQGAPLFGYDALRTLRLMAFSALLGTPMGHVEYEVLDKVVMPSDPHSPMAVLLKVAFDQLIETPIGMTLFFGSIKAMEGKPRDVLPTLRAKLWPSLLANWCFWPAAQLVNFTLVPLDMRILYVNLLCIVWTAYISLVANAPMTAEATAADAAGQKQQQQQQQWQPLALPLRSLERLRVGSRVRAVLGGLRKA